MKTKKVQKLTPFWLAQSTIILESAASGLRSMKKGQKHLLKLIEAEIARRREEESCKH